MKTDQPKLETHDRNNGRQNRSVVFMSMMFSGVATLFSAAFVFVFAAFGGPWVDRLDEQVGEVLTTRARSLVRIGQTTEAVDMYQKALRANFSDPVQHAWVSHELARLLLEQGAYEEAIRVCKASTELEGENGEAFGIWYKALELQDKRPAALDLTREWFAWGQARNGPSSMAWAKFYEGLQLSALNQNDQALQAFEQGAGIHPKGNIGQLLDDAILRASEKLKTSSQH